MAGGLGYVVSQSREKKDVNYRQRESCGVCVHFFSHLGKCELIGGRISPEAVCNEYSIREKSNYDKDFFTEQAGSDK